MEHDLAPYLYRIDDPLYNDLKDVVLAIFHKNKALQIPVKIRCDTADALGREGDPGFLTD